MPRVRPSVPPCPVCELDGIPDVVWTREHLHEVHPRVVAACRWSEGRPSRDEIVADLRRAEVRPGPSVGRLPYIPRFSSTGGDRDVGITLHGLRHTHATMLLRAGVPITAVAQRLGHANPSITLAVYSHAIPADDALAADATGRVLFGDLVSA